MGAAGTAIPVPGAVLDRSRTCHHSATIVTPAAVPFPAALTTPQLALAMHIPRPGSSYPRLPTARRMYSVRMPLALAVHFWNRAGSAVLAVRSCEPHGAAALCATTCACADPDRVMTAAGIGVTPGARWRCRWLALGPCGYARTLIGMYACGMYMHGYAVYCSTTVYADTAS